MLNRTARMNSALLRHVGGVGLFGGGVATDVEIDPVEFDRRLKPVPVASDSKVSTRISRLRAALILHIHGCRDIAQVVESVVCPIAVNVINVSGRPDPVRGEPRKTVRRVKTLIDTKPDITLRGFAPSDITGSRPIPLSRGQADEFAGLWIVIEKFAQTLRGKIGLSHDAPSKRIGQRPASADNASGLRYFSGLHALLREPNC